MSQEQRRPEDMAAEDDSFQLPPVHIVGQSASLILGVAVRAAVAGGVWSGIYAAIDAARGAEGSSWLRNKKACKMWAGSFVLELIPSLLLVPGRYLTGKTVPRLVADFVFPGPGQLFSFLDRFSPGHYIAYSMNRLSPAAGADADFSFFLWHLPATLVTAAKLYVRQSRKPKDTKTKRVLAMLGLQYFTRLLMISFSVYLPSSEKEMLLALLLTTFDRYSDAYLIRNTWPFDLDEDVVEAK
jgi:hypothetical protein